MSPDLIFICIGIGSIGIGALMAAAFGIPEDEPEAPVPSSPTQDEVDRWQEATDRTFARQGIRRVR